MPAWKHKPKWMPQYIASAKELEAYQWCVRNNIRISPEAIKGKPDEYKIAINTNGKWTSSPPYTKEIVWTKYYEFCTYYYKKYGP